MKKIIVFLILLYSVSLSAQTGTGWKPIGYKANFKDSVYFKKLPKVVSDTLATRAYARGYGGTGTLSASDTALMLTPYINRADTAAMMLHYIDRTENLLKLSISDTSSMLSHYIDRTDNLTKISRADSSGNAPGNYVTRQDLLVEGGLHVNISDTAAMLTPYINRADTSIMLSHYALLSEITESTGISAADTASMLTPYINRADTASMLAAYPRYFYAANGSLSLSGADPITLASTASTSVTLPTSGTLATTQNINDSLDTYLSNAVTGVALADSTGNAVGNYITRQDLLVEGGLHVNIADSTAGAEHYSSWYKAENIRKTVKTFFVFAAGGGNPADTVAMKDSTILGSFYNGGSQTIVVDTLNAIMDHGVGLDTLAFNIVWGKSFQTVSPSGHLSNTQFNCGRTAGTPAQITNLTTGNVFTSFDHTEIPPGCRVWGKFMYVPADGLKRKPKYFEVSLIGHYK